MSQLAVRRFVCSVAVILSIITVTSAQAKKPEFELDRLRAEFIGATKDYKASLMKLRPIYERNLKSAEEKLAASSAQFEQHLISPRDLQDAKRNVEEAKEKIDEIDRQYAGADAQIAQVVEEIEVERKQLKQKYRKAVRANPRCKSWSLFVSEHKNSRLERVSITFVCRRR